MDWNKIISGISTNQKEIVHKRWNSTCAALGLTGYERRFEGIWVAYSNPSRGYHGIAHLDQCLTMCESNRSSFDHPDEIAMALFFHDLVYDTHKTDGMNVFDSASKCEDFLQSSGCNRAAINRITTAICYTTHTMKPVTKDEGLVMDIDLSMIQYYNFEAIEHLVRKEYEWVPLAEYQRARKDILIRLYLREYLYSSELFRNTLETRTKEQLFRMITFNASRILVAGTFDLFHKGHRLLIKKAILLAGRHSKVIIGLTSDEMASRKSHPVQPYHTRERQISNFIARSKPGLSFEIIPLNDPLGDAGTNPDYDILVASKETECGARLVNKVRERNGLCPLILVLIEEVVGSDGKRISSTRLRSSETSIMSAIAICQ